MRESPQVEDNRGRSGRVAEAFTVAPCDSGRDSPAVKDSTQSRLPVSRFFSWALPKRQRTPGRAMRHPLFLAALVLFTGIALGAKCAHMVLRAYRGGPLVATPGIIVESMVEEVWNAGRSRRKALVRYQYLVGNQQFLGTKIDPLDSGGSSDAADELAGRFFRKQAVTVYYSPENPTDSVLIPRFLESDRSGVILFGISGVFFTALGLFLLSLRLNPEARRTYFEALDHIAEKK